MYHWSQFSDTFLLKLGVLQRSEMKFRCYRYAKVTDLAFNWVAARGLQIVLTSLSYRVFTDALMRTTEMTYMPYGLFTSHALTRQSWTRFGN